MKEIHNNVYVQELRVKEVIISTTTNMHVADNIIILFPKMVPVTTRCYYHNISTTMFIYGENKGRLMISHEVSGKSMEH